MLTIPFFIVMGVVGLCPFLYFILVALTWGDGWGVGRMFCGICFSIVIGCFLLGWLIYGSVMVFSMKSDEDQSQPDNCQSANMSAYIVTVISKFTLLNN